MIAEISFFSDNLSPSRRYSFVDTDPNDTPIADFIYTYDANGNILSQEFAHRTGTPTPDNIYTYDKLDRLTRSAYHNN